MSAKAKSTPKKTTATATKDVVYVDVDDEITSIIDKVVESPHKIVALVLPKRAAVLQSVVNMKLLKRSGDEAGKHVVLITSEAGLLPLAGSVGLHVAKTAQSKPVVPAAPETAEDDAEAIEEPDIATEDIDEDAADFDKEVSGEQPIGELAGIDDTIELDDVPEETVVASTKHVTKKKTKKNGKLKVPNFNKFRLWVVLGIVAVLLLIGGWVLAAVVLPKATIVVTTDSEELQNTVDLTLDTTATAVDIDKATVPAIRVQSTKTTSQQVEATGTQNLGEKAEGEIRITIERCAPNISTPSNIPSGTGVSTGGKTYITQESASFTIMGPTSGSCVNYRSGWTDIVAQTGGSDFNVSNATFTVAGNSAATGSGSASGGTDNTVKVVSQADIDKAKDQLAAADDSAVSSELEQQLSTQKVFVITDSLTKSTPEITTSVNAGTQADSVTVTQKVTYSMLGAQQSDLEKLITTLVEKDIDPERQTVLDTGLNKATFGLQSQQNDSAQVVVSMRAVSLAGPELDEAAIKESAAGKKGGEVREALLEYPGVTDVEVTYSPFWVSAVPSNVNKITVEIQ